MTHNNTPKDIATSLKDGAASVVEKVKESGGEAVESLRDLASDVQNNVTSRADQAKESLAEGGHRLADSLRSTASQQGDGTLQGAMLGAVAGSVADMSDTLHGQSLSNIVANVQGMARRNPGAFILGAAVAGFALARFSRASADTVRDQGRVNGATPVSRTEALS